MFCDRKTSRLVKKDKFSAVPICRIVTFAAAKLTDFSKNPKAEPTHFQTFALRQMILIVQRINQLKKVTEVLFILRKENLNFFQSIFWFLIVSYCINTVKAIIHPPSSPPFLSNLVAWWSRNQIKWIPNAENFFQKGGQQYSQKFSENFMKLISIQLAAARSPPSPAATWARTAPPARS